MDRALKYLGPRARSRRQVAEMLDRGGYEAPEIEKTLTRLAELAILDDAAYALEVAKQGSRKGRSRRLTGRDLGAQGIASVDAEQALNAIFTGDTADQKVEELARRKLDSLKRLPPEAQYRRLAGFLARRGHDHETVAQVCGRLLGDFGRSD